jgi:peptidoglycan hydrolase-like protein with peptidoglycan-binding domain
MLSSTLLAYIIFKKEKKEMKYSSTNKPLVCMQTQSTCYKGTDKMTIKGILWHSTGANNPTLKRYVQPSDVKPPEDTYTKEKWLEVLGKNIYNNDWNHIEKQAGLNAWIGKLANGTIASIQTMPWDFGPWGCGSSTKGSCNNGWIQFEICEDGLADKTYFDKVYKEACELTAYLCKIYNIDPKGTVVYNGVKVPTILCHQDSYKLKLGSNHSDIYPWFKKHGKTMDNVRNDVSALLNPAKPSTKEIYRVRKSWLNVVSQKGAFSVFKNAVDCCNKAGAGYKVFDSKGVVKYEYVAQTSKPTIKDTSLRSGSTGNKVKELQTNLKKLGYDCGNIDGIFGSKTVAAVKEFQKDQKLVIDGIVGAGTQTAITKAIKNLAKNITVTYRVWDDVKNAWLPVVQDKTDYAGNFGHDICAIYADLSYGDIWYQAHTKGGKWLGEVKNLEDYAGIYNKPIDAIRMKTNTGKTIHYRVHLRKQKRWLSWVTGYNINDAKNGYAGILGQEIDAIQIYVK